MERFFVICANICHPSGKNYYFFAHDDSGETLEFQSFDEASEWCENNDTGFFAFSILRESDFEFR